MHCPHQVPYRVAAPPDAYDSSDKPHISLGQADCRSPEDDPHRDTGSVNPLIWRLERWLRAAGVSSCQAGCRAGRGRNVGSRAGSLVKPQRPGSHALDPEHLVYCPRVGVGDRPHYVLVGGLDGQKGDVLLVIAGNRPAEDDGPAAGEHVGEGLHLGVKAGSRRTT